MEDQLIMINVELKNLDFVAVYLAKGSSLLPDHFFHLQYLWLKLLCRSSLHLTLFIYQL